MDMPTPDTAQLEASFDIVARQEAQEAAITGLKGDVDEVKSRLDRVSRAAARPVLDGAGAPGFVVPPTNLRHPREGGDPSPTLAPCDAPELGTRLRGNDETNKVHSPAAPWGGFFVPQDPPTQKR